MEPPGEVELPVTEETIDEHDNWRRDGLSG
jgi:hypothetical protein